MEIIINRQLYYISWKYFMSETKLGRREVTLLEVKLNNAIVAEKFAYKNPIDLFVKSTARKVTLKRLLNDWKVSKEERANVWNQYFSKISKK